MVRILYRDSQTLELYELLTTEQTLPPRLIALLYLLRWRLEKLFDTGKNKLAETKAWATGPVAREIQGHFFALTHNLLVLLRRELERTHEIREEKLERKRSRALEERSKAAQAKGRVVPPVYWQLPAAVQLLVQYVRALRNGIWNKERRKNLLPRLSLVLRVYL